MIIIAELRKSYRIVNTFGEMISCFCHEELQFESYHARINIKIWFFIQAVWIGNYWGRSWGFSEFQINML